jgi:tRNA-dihydrouridine synthase B
MPSVNLPESSLSRTSGFDVGQVRVEPPLLLAPMEDVSNQPFRRIAKRIGAPGLMFTEFVSSMAIRYGAQKSLKKLSVHTEERPLGIQIFGNDPDTMAAAAEHAESSGADLVDINMGCWVPKVCRNGSGAALLKDTKTALEVVRAVIRAVRVPVTVKVRAGWEQADFTAPDLAKRFQDEGVRMLTLHARFARQGFEGKADWDLIGRLRKVLRIPLVGNGDVRSPEDAARMFRDTGCDGVMAGRVAISNPWALSRIRAAFTGDPPPPEPTLAERVHVALEHLRLMIAYEAGAESLEAARALGGLEYRQAEERACRRLRGQIPLYVKGVPGAAATRERICKCASLAEVEAVLEELLESHGENRRS